MELIDREWKEFYIKDVFDYVERGKRLTKKTQEPGTIPYISSTAQNNGVNNFISNTNQVRLFSNCISIANSGSVGSSFYHPYAFVASDHVTHLKNDSFNEAIYVFITVILSRLSSKYNFNLEINDKRISKEKIMLPVDEFGNPDYLFMEEYVREEEKRKNEKYIAYAEKRLKTLQYIEIPMLDEKEWKEFFIGGELGVFKIKSTSSGIDKNKLNNTKGKIPYITRTDKSNGIDLFVSDIQNEKYAIDAGNIISVGLDTQTVFYQPHTFYTGQNIQVVSNSNLNEYNAQFICKLLEIQLRKFNWGGNGATLGRLARTKIMLPIDDFGTPDYSYMEQYTKNLIVVKLKKYLDFAKK